MTATTSTPTASLSDPPARTVVPPGEGATGRLGSVGVQFKLWGTQTNGTVSVVEHPFPVGALVVPQPPDHPAPSS
jgi:hypothetical protein